MSFFKKINTKKTRICLMLCLTLALCFGATINAFAKTKVNTGSDAADWLINDSPWAENARGIGTAIYGEENYDKAIEFTANTFGVGVTQTTQNEDRYEDLGMGGKMYYMGYHNIVDGVTSIQQAADNSASVILGNDQTSAIGDVMSRLRAVVADTILPAMQGVGIAIALVFFLISLIRAAQADHFNLDIFIKHFTKAVIPVAIISFCPLLFKYLLDFGESLGTYLSSLDIVGKQSYSAESMESTILDLAEKHDDLSDGFGLLAGSLLPMIAISLTGLAVQAVVYIIAFTRIIELYIRGAFLPIPLALMADDGWQGAGGRYIKKFLAVAAQGGMIILIGKIGAFAISVAASHLISSFEQGGGTGASGMMGAMAIIIAMGIGMCTAMHKSIGWMNDIFGV